MRRRLSLAQQDEIGAAVLQARDAGAAWKLLSRVYGLSRRQLQRYVAKRNKITVMSHLGGCPGDETIAHDRAVTFLSARMISHATDDRPTGPVPPAR